MSIDNSTSLYEHKPFTKVDTKGKVGVIQIRLLSLHPATSGDSLIGSIIERREGQEYEALSYCWGPPCPTPAEADSISIVEDHQYSTLPIRSNLASALRHLRYKSGRYRPLWIDSICINQENDVEKSEQIPLMDRIFQEATRVCIWLGDGAGENDKVALSHIKDIIKLQGLEDLIHPKYTDHWAALASLMRREWFSRRWVVQEIAYARQAEVYWGDESINWKDLADGVALFGSKAPEIAELFKQDRKYNHRGDFIGEVEALSANRLVQTIGKVFRKADNGQKVERLMSLEALVSNLSAFNVSRPHDIIYAVLSLAKDTITTAMKPREPRPLKPRRYSKGTIAPFSQNLPPAPESMTNLGLEPLDTEMAQTMHGAVPVSPIQETQTEGIYELMSDSMEESLVRIRERGFSDEDINETILRLKQHKACMPTPFDYDLMKKKLIADRNSLTLIRRRFWDDEILKWLSQDNRGLCSAVLKLLVHESALKLIAKNFLLTLQGRVKVKTFHVDYQKKFYEVCKDFVNFTIRSSRSLDMLCRPWAPDKEDLPDSDKEVEHLPSWICPLSRSPFLPRPDGNFGRVNADLLVGMPDSGGSTYSTSANTVPDQYFFGGDGERSLFVAGLQIDEIRETDTEAVEGNIPSSWLKLGDWENTKNEPPESFWRTIVADRNENGQNPPSYYQRACQYAFGQRTVRGSLNTDRLISQKISKVMTDYLKRVQAVVWMRKLIRTRYGDPATKTQPQPEMRINGSRVGEEHNYQSPGRLGLVPHTAQIGDRICMLRGCSVPVVLRPVPGDPTSYDKKTKEDLNKLQKSATGTDWDHMSCKLIGECYVHGVMDGEVFKIRDDRNLLDTIFEIR